MIDQGSELSVSRQCEILELNRTGVYYTPRPVSEEDLILMRRIGELHLKQQSAKFNELRQSAARRASDIERSGGIGNESPNKPTNGKTSAHALVGRRCAFASTGSMRGPRSPTRGAFSGMVPSLPGNSPDHVCPSGPQHRSTSRQRSSIPFPVDSCVRCGGGWKRDDGSRTEGHRESGGTPTGA
jgi:hypothetical protein